MKKIKLGIIGCGIAAKELHFPALMRLQDKYEITAVSNHTEPKAREFSALTGGVPYYINYIDLLNDNNIEAVDIALPIDLNYKVTRDALKHGKHVFLEKPLAGNLTEAKKMLGFPDRFKRIMMVAENFRYRLVFRKVKELLEKGKIGTPYAVSWNLYYNVTEDSKYAKTKWRRHHKYPGGFMNDAGVHNIAAIRLLFGDILWVNAFTGSVNPVIGTPDTMGIQYETKKIKGVFNIFFSVNGHWEDKLLVFGSAGTLEVNTNSILIKKENKKEVKIDAGDDSGFYEEFLNFYYAIRKRSEIKSTFAEAYKDLETVLTALKSAERGKRFYL